MGRVKVGWPTLATALPAILLLALQCLQLPSDPAAGVTASNSPFTDEGWNVLASRNWVLLGDSSAGNWALYLIQLPFAVLEAITFALLGVGIVQARLAALLCTVGAVALLGAVVRRRLGSAAGVTAGGGAGVLRPGALLRPPRLRREPGAARDGGGHGAALPGSGTCHSGACGGAAGCCWRSPSAPRRPR